jgi:Cytotoxic
MQANIRPSAAAMHLICTRMLNVKPRIGGGLRSRWKDERGRILERDYLHDTVEVYDPSGRRHLDDFDPWDGRQVGRADRSRHVEP